jgi:hypothetical protein
MADKKISALTGATTPLAGTEVLPIVQAGATVKVAVSDLTAGRAISATQLTLTTGNLIVASGQGVDFSATPSAGTSELFNDYEEGTWTPTLTTTGTGFTAISYTTQSGVYTKVGNTVTVYFSIVIASVTVGAASGAIVVAGMPFTASNGTGNTGFQTNFVTVGPDFMQFYGAGTNALLRYKVGGTWANVAPANAQGGLQLDGSMTYFV